MTRFVFVGLAVIGLIYKAECDAPTAWTTPVISTVNGSAPLIPTVPENTAIGALAITIAATGATHYAIHGQEVTGKFSIDETTGILSLAAGTLDFETKPTYTLTITGGDGSVASGTITTTLSITNVNEPPKFAHAAYSVTAVTGSGAGTTITTVTATDQDANDTITYTITGGNVPADFAIAANGDITVATGRTLNMTSKASYSLTVTATDAGSLTASTTVSITVVMVSNSAVSVAATGFLCVVAFMLFYIM